MTMPIDPVRPVPIVRRLVTPQQAGITAALRQAFVAPPAEMPEDMAALLARMA